jgi:hypothetical protein
MPKEKEKPQRIVAPVVIDPNQDFSVDEAAAIRRCCRAQIYKDLKAKPPRLVAFKRGRRTYISGAELIRRAGAPS